MDIQERMADDFYRTALCLSISWEQLTTEYPHKPNRPEIG